MGKAAQELFPKHALNMEVRIIKTDTMFSFYISNKKLSNFLFILVLFSLSIDVFGQECPNPCNNSILIPNNDFEQFDVDCLESSECQNSLIDLIYGDGMGGFFCDCIDEWDDFGRTPDFFSPDIYPNYPAFEQLSNLITSGVAGLRDGTEGIRVSNINIPSAPNINLNVTLDIGGFFTDNNWESILEIPSPSQTFIQVESEHLTWGELEIDDSYNILNGMKTICLQITDSPFFQEIKHDKTLTISNWGSSGNNWILVDNISMNCEISNANLEINNWKIGHLKQDFKLTEINSELYTTNVESILWNFDDGKSSEELNPTHIYEMPGLYTVTAYITDESGCCTTITKEVEATEGCGTHTLTGINQVDDLEVLLGVSSGDFLDASATVEIDGTLEIDKNVTFGSNLNFLLTPNSSIVVKPNMQMLKRGGFIGPCSDYQFQGIIVEEDGVISLRHTKIWGANVAVLLEPNARIWSLYSEIDDCNVGIFFKGEAKIDYYTQNRISNCQIGLFAYDTHELIIGDAPSGWGNSFDDCDTGIFFRDTGGKISQCHFNRCKTGIVLNRSPQLESTLTGNIIDATDFGIKIIDHYSNVWVGGNLIRNISGPPVKTGIYVERSAINTSNAQGYVVASEYGFKGINPLWFNIHEEDIEMEGDGTGIFLRNPSGNAFINNNIFWGSMKTGVHCISCDESNIINNDITNGGTDHSIVLEGGSGATIANNHVGFGAEGAWKGIALYGHNGGEISNNKISAIWNGLLINDLSDNQFIGCNQFVYGKTDIHSRSILGIQPFHLNRFYQANSKATVENLTFFEINQSRFEVEDEFSYHLPAQFTPGFFEVKNDPSPFPSACQVTTFSPPNPDDQKFWCWYLQHIKEELYEDPQSAWVKRYKALKLNKLKDQELILADCIPFDEQYCHLEDFISIEFEIDNILQYGENQEGNFEEKSAEMIDIEIEEQIGNLESLDCQNEMLLLYRDIYLIYLKDMIRSELSVSEISQVNETAELCSHIYGDVVYWARGILDHRGESRLFDEENCNYIGHVESRTNDDLTRSDITAFPNPTKSFVTFENKTEYDFLDIKIADSVGKIHSVPNKLKDHLVIDFASFGSGIYFVTLSHPSGYNSVKRIFVSK